MIWLILFLGFVLRLVNINQSFWLDEATQAVLSSKSLEDIIFHRGADFHPPLFYIIVHFWMKLAVNDIWLRMLPVIFGVGSVFMTYILCKKIFDKKTALLVSLLLAVSPYHIYYSQELRMYSSAVFFALGSMYFFYSLLRRTNLNLFLGYVFSTTALLYTHYLGFFILFTQIFFIILIKRDKIKIILNALIVISILFSFWVPQLLIQLRYGIEANQYLPGWSNVLSLSFYSAVPVTLLKFTIGKMSFENSTFYIAFAFFILVIILYLLLQVLKKIKKEDDLLISLWFFMPLILALLLSLILPIFQPFRLIFILPAFYILIVRSALQGKYFGKQILALIFFLSLSGLFISNTYPKLLREDWRGATNTVNSFLGEKSVVVFAWTETFDPYKWYGGKDGFGVVSRFPASYDDVYKNLNRFMQNNQIVVFDYLQDLSDPKRQLQKSLKDYGYIQTKIYDFRGVGFVEIYAKIGD